MTKQGISAPPAPLLRRLLVLVLAVAGPLLPGAVAPAAAEETPLFATATTAFTTNADPVVGERFKIVGQVFLLLGDSPAPLPSQTVELERRAMGADSWEVVATATTKETTLPNGDKHIMYTFKRVADRTAKFRVRFEPDEGSEAIGGSVSDAGDLDPTLVRVHRRMPIRLLQPRPSRLFMAGTVTPLYARQRVAVLRKTCRTCDWAPYARPRTNRNGEYQVRLSAPQEGSHYFVARVPGSRGFAPSSSQQARIKAG